MARIPTGGGGDIEDILSQDDDKKPVTRGEIRAIHRSIRNDLKWLAVSMVAVNQALYHVNLPAYAGLFGSAAIVAVSVVKIVVGGKVG